MSAVDSTYYVNNCIQLITHHYINSDIMYIDNYNDNVKIVDKLVDIIAVLENLKANEENKMTDV